MKRSGAFVALATVLACRRAHVAPAPAPAAVASPAAQPATAHPVERIGPLTVHIAARSAVARRGGEFVSRVAIRMHSVLPGANVEIVDDATLSVALGDAAAQRIALGSLSHACAVDPDRCAEGIDALILSVRDGSPVR